MAAKVWDSFLTERDKAHLAAGWQKTEPYGFGPRAALVIVDNWTSIAGGPEDVLDAIKHSPSSCGADGWEAVKLTTSLLEAARRRGMVVVHTMVTASAGTGILSPDRLPVKPPYEFCAENYPEPGELIIDKPHASAFHTTSLAAQLVTSGIDSVLVCGNTTSGCVRATVVDASAMGFKVAIVEECVFDRTQASHAMSLFDMDRKYGDVISLADALHFVEHDAVV